MAQRLELTTAALEGEPVTLGEGILPDDSNRSVVSAGTTGLIAYRTGGGGRRQLTWFDRSGVMRGTLGDPDGTLMYPSVSPDGRRVAVSRTVQGNIDLWLLDATRSSRFTFDGAMDELPVWSPDGARVVFRSTHSGHHDLWEKRTSGAGVEELVAASDQTKSPTNWSSDGRFLLYQNQNADPETGTDLWVMPMVGDHTPSVFLRTRFREVWGAFSPDGHWVAYQSDESGRPEIYVRPFVPPGAADGSVGADRNAGLRRDQTGAQWQVSTEGGIYPVWRRDGKELYYLSPNGAMMAAPITMTGSALAPGEPVTLFTARIYGGGVEVRQGRSYDVAPDGRFLIDTVLDADAAPITVLANWNPEAKK